MMCLLRQVFMHYLKGGMLLDVITGFPVQWLIMGAYTPCSEVDIGLIRTLRIARFARIFKLFQQPQVHGTRNGNLSEACGGTDGVKGADEEGEGARQVMQVHGTRNSGDIARWRGC